MQKGFTLIELAIVLVIVGLLISGVLVGRDLIEGARINQQIEQLSGFETARNTFLLKYGKNPGDFDKASTFFGSSVPNGDGNGDLTNASLVDELSLFWQHLSLAGLINGDYVGLVATHYVVGQTFPYAVFSEDSCVNVSSTNITSGGQNYQPFYYELGKLWSVADDQACSDYLLKPLEAYQIDIKMDDGKPTAGKVRGDTVGIYGDGCNEVGGQYYLSDETPQCYLDYIFIGSAPNQ